MDSREKNFSAIGVPGGHRTALLPPLGVLFLAQGSFSFSVSSTSLSVDGQHDFAVRAFAQELQHLEVLRRVHCCQGLSCQVAHLTQEVGGCLETYEQSAGECSPEQAGKLQT